MPERYAGLWVQFIERLEALLTRVQTSNIFPDAGPPDSPYAGGFFYVSIALGTFIESGYCSAHDIGVFLLPVMAIASLSLALSLPHLFADGNHPFAPPKVRFQTKV